MTTSKTLWKADEIRARERAFTQHLLKNRSPDDLVYLMGGEDKPVDVVDYPHLDKRYLLVGTPKGTEFYELGDPIKPFGPA